MIHGEIITAVDLGSYTIKALMLEWRRDNPAKVLALTTLPSEGIKNGEIIDSHAVRERVDALLKKLEHIAGRKVSNYSVLYNGVSCQGNNLRGALPIADKRRLNKSHVDAALKTLSDGEVCQGMTILHNMPSSFTLDNKNYSEPPFGLFGKYLVVNSHLLTADAKAVDSLLPTLQPLEYQLNEIVFGNLASSYTLLSRKQRHQGALLIDIGYGKTSVIIFHRGVPFLSDVHRLGGRYLNHDVATVLKTSLTQAEQLIEDYGGCAGEWLNSKTPLANLPAIEQGKLCRIIEARCEDIFLWVKSLLINKSIDVSKIDTIMLSGGVAQLEGIDVLAGRIFNHSVNIGAITGIEQLPAQWNGPVFAPILGLGLYIIEQRKSDGSANTFGRRFKLLFRPQVD